MNIKTYLENTKQSINEFAGLHKQIKPTTVWRACKSMPIRPCNAAAIEQATGGAVTLRELLFPDQKGT